MKKVNATTIKVIAIIAMTIDHIAFTFVSADTLTYYIMRLVGRLTAPLMCFFLVEGFRHTHDKKKYLLRLILFAAISQPVYYLFIFHSVPYNTLHCMRNMNIMFTLALAMITLLIVTNEKLSMMSKALLTAITISFAQFGDWSYIIPIWTLIFYFLSNEKKKMYIIYLIATLIILPYQYLKFFDSFIDFTYNYGAALALIPIAFYNGQRNSSSSALKKKISKWFFYFYYPLHMISIYLVYITKGSSL